MKKFLFLLITAFAVASCNDDCDHGFDGGGINSDILVGSWYEDTQNEEDTYSPSSAFYGKYCNKLVQGEGQGTYRLDTERNRLTWSYHVNGMGMTSDWKLRDVSKYQFVQYSDVAILTYGKIVDTYNMNGGDTKTISFNELSVQGYESTNEHIATVSSDGLVTATGEKGTAYIKVKCLEANVYVKVIVGDNYPDLWIDYSGLLGNDYAAMKNLLGDPDSSSENGGYSLYVYVTELHNILRGLRVSINSDTHKIDQIDMIIREGVPQEELLAYMNAHYYRLGGNYGTQYHYSTSSELEKSRAVYALETDTEKTGMGGCTILMMEEDLYEELMNTDIVPKFSKFFGLDEEHVKASVETRGWKYYDEFDSYSHNGSVAYTFSGYDYTNTIEFVYNSDNLVSQCVVYMSSNTPDRLLLKYLEDNYTEAENEKTLLKHVYYNSAKTIKVEFDILTKILYFSDLRQKLFDRVILGTYWKGMGKSKQEITDLFGEPYSYGTGTDADNMAYIIFGDYIKTVYFYLSKTTGKVIQINMQLQDETNDDEVIAYLNKWYHFLESEDTAQGPRMRWLNAEKPENATLRATYYPDYNMMVYGIPE